MNRTARWKRATVALMTVSMVALLVLAGCGASNPSAPAAERLRIDVTTPTARGALTEESLTLTGVVSNPAARLTINDAPVAIGDGGAWSQEVPLAYGSNRFVIRAEGEGLVAASRTVTFSRALTLDIASPAAESAVSQNRVTVTGTVSDPAATVEITGVPVTVGADGTFSHVVVLHYPLNILHVTARVGGVDPISRNLTVRYAP